MNRHPRRLIAAGALAALLAGGAAVPAGAATVIEEAPEVSWDGADGTWSQDIDVPMFSVQNMVPCNTELAAALVRNGGTRNAHLTVTIKNVRLAEGRSASDPFFSQIHLQTFQPDSDNLAVDDTIPNLVGTDVVLYDGEVAPGTQVPVRAQYAWMYGNACKADPENAANGTEGPWMDFDVVATMRYVVDETTSAPPTVTTTTTATTTVSTTAAPTTVTAPTDTLIPPTSTTAPDSTPTNTAPGAGGPGATQPPAAGGGWLPNTGLSTPLASLGLTALVLLGLGLPLVMRRRKDKRTHA